MGPILSNLPTSRQPCQRGTLCTLQWRGSHKALLVASCDCISARKSGRIGPQLGREQEFWADLTGGKDLMETEQGGLGARSNWAHCRRYERTTRTAVLKVMQRTFTISGKALRLAPRRCWPHTATRGQCKLASGKCNQRWHCDPSRWGRRAFLGRGEAEPVPRQPSLPHPDLHPDTEALVSAPAK